MYTVCLPGATACTSVPAWGILVTITLRSASAQVNGHGASACVTQLCADLTSSACQFDMLAATVLVVCVFW